MRRPLAIALASALFAIASGVAFSTTEESALRSAFEAGEPGAAVALAQHYERSNLVDQSRDILIEAAAAGDQSAALLLAEHYITHGLPANVDDAILVIRSRRTELGPEDMTRLGLRLADRIISPDTPRKQQLDWSRYAVEFLASARAAGDAEALWRTGYLGSLGLPGPQNPESASATITKAAYAGHAAAAYWMARYHLDGTYTPRDVTEGVRFLGLAARSGHQNAMLELASYHAGTDDRLARFWTDTAKSHQGRLSPVEPELIPVATRRRPGSAPSMAPAGTAPASLPAPMASAVNHRSPESLGSAAADTELTRAQAEIRRLTLDVERLSAENTTLRSRLEDLQARYDRLEASQRTAAAGAERRNAEGLAYYAAGDYESALIAFRVGLEADYAPSLTNLALLYLNGHGIRQDVRQAEQLLKRASSLGDLNATENLARMYQHGLGLHRDPSRAISWYQRALAQGSLTAANELATLKAN